MVQPAHLIAQIQARLARLQLRSRFTALWTRFQSLSPRARLLVVAGAALALLVAILLGRQGFARQTPVAAKPAVTIATADSSLVTHVQQPVKILARSTTGAKQMTYNWTLGDGSAATGAEITHNYANSGYYVVSVTATDSAGRKSTAQVILSVAPIAPKAILKAAQDRAYSYMLTANGATSTGADLRFFWDFGDGHTDDSGIQRLARHNYLAAGTYQLSLTVIDSAGQRSTTTTQIVVKPLKGN